MKVTPAVHHGFYTHELRSYSKPMAMTTSSIAMCENGVIEKSVSFSQVIEDVIGYLGNLIFFPILGHQVIVYQIILGILLPILLPYIIITEVIHIILNILTCGCYKRFLSPSLDLSQPSSKEEAQLLRLVQVYGSESICEYKQVELAHIMSRYIDFAQAYADPEGYGMKNGNFQAVINVEVDGRPHQFQFSPSDEKEDLIQEYLELVTPDLKNNSEVKYHFIGLDYHYILGLLKMRIQTDEVFYDCNSGTSTGFSICGGWFPLFAPKIGKHESHQNEEFDYFALWPGFTRKLISEKITRQLGKGKIEPNSISLLNLQRIVRGER